MNRNLWLLAIWSLLLVGVIVAADTGWGAPLLRLINSIWLGDKVCHAIFMGVLTWRADRAIPSSPVFATVPRVSRTAFVVAALVVAEEVSQLWIVGRTFSYGDLAADFVGIGLALLSGKGSTPRTWGASPPTPGAG